MKPLEHVYISYTTAKALDKCGIKLRTEGYYYGGDNFYLDPNRYQILDATKEFLRAPTQSQLQAYLRRMHQLEVWAQPFVNPPDENELDGTYSAFVFRDKKWIRDTAEFDTYEKAFEEGLFTALQFLENQLLP